MPKHFKQLSIYINKIYHNNILQHAKFKAEISTNELNTTPSTPTSGERKIYSKSNGVYSLDSAGTEKQLITEDEANATIVNHSTLTSADGSPGEYIINSDGNKFLAVQDGSGTIFLPVNNSGTLEVATDPSTLGVISGIAIGETIVDTTATPNDIYIWNGTGFVTQGSGGGISIPVSATERLGTPATGPTTTTTGDEGELVTAGGQCYLLSDITGNDGLTIVSHSSGYNFSVFVLSNGTVKTVGSNTHGQLGDGTNVDKSSPVQVPGINNAVGVFAGTYQTYIILSNGTIKAMGTNWTGQLGDGTSVSRNSPVTVSGISNAISVASGCVGNHTIFLLSDGTAKATGENSKGELPDGTTINRLSPVTVSGLTNIVDISTGLRNSIFILSDVTVKSIGLNNYGQLGDGTNMDRLIPVTVPGISTAIGVSSGYSFTSFILTNGTVKSTGNNDLGQLGDGSTVNRSIPQWIAGFTPPVYSWDTVTCPSTNAKILSNGDFSLSAGAGSAPSQTTFATGTTAVDDTNPSSLIIWRWDGTEWVDVTSLSDITY